MQIIRGHDFRESCGDSLACEKSILIGERGMGSPRKTLGEKLDQVSRDAAPSRVREKACALIKQAFLIEASTDAIYTSMGESVKLRRDSAMSKYDDDKLRLELVITPGICYSNSSFGLFDDAKIN
ncbi:unnamed protein product [Dovyalis caffra]|uniref:Uncharacterized protein n=1 Tax=Dovyalis caffra TaxID=77055 RepID=A0AAV1R835_9ROSI|nr:unnamed protein product [Dovyalis caffra]